MICDEIFGQSSEIIIEGILDDLLHASILNLMNGLGLKIDHILSHSRVSCRQRIICTGSIGKFLDTSYLLEHVVYLETNGLANQLLHWV